MIPNLLPYEVGPFTIVDVRGISDPRERSRVVTQGKRHLLALIRKTRTTTLCKPEKFYSRRSDAWKRLARQDPNADWSTFVATFDPRFDDSDYDPRLHEKALAIFRGDPWDRDLLGVLFLYNVEVMETSPTRIGVTAYPAPGIPFTGDADWADSMRRLLKEFLEVDLLLDDGRVLRILSWKFPTRNGHAWSGEPWAERLVSALEADGFVRTDSGGKLKEFSRRIGE